MIIIDPDQARATSLMSIVRHDLGDYIVDEVIHRNTPMENTFGLAQYGYEPEAYLSLVRSEYKTESESGYLIVLTIQPIQSRYLIAHVPSLNASIVSLNSLSAAHMDAKHAAVLIYGCLLTNFEFEVSSQKQRPCDGRQPCINAPLQLAKIPRDLCATCLQGLKNNGSIARSITHKVLHRVPDNGTLVVILHGIRTHASWATSLSQKLQAHGFVPRIPLYGRFSTVQFLLDRKASKSWPVSCVSDEFKSISERYPDHRISVVAHSYGTKILGEVLRLQPQLNLHKIILYGSVLPQNFHWTTLREKRRVEGVLNICADGDAVPIFSHFRRDMGASGTYFFSSADVQNIRVANHNHSSILRDDQVVSTLTLPFLYDDNFIVQTKSVEPRRMAKWLQKVVRPSQDA